MVERLMGKIEKWGKRVWVFPFFFFVTRVWVFLRSYVNLKIESLLKVIGKTKVDAMSNHI